MTMGQIDHRLVKPYRRLPLQLGCLINPHLSEGRRVAIAERFLQMKPCCVDQCFGQPVLKSMRVAGGSQSIVPPNPFHGDLVLGLRTKVSNIEIEDNFARASSSRCAMRGRNHNASSMTAKHVTAEAKLMLRRQVESQRCTGGATNHIVAGPFYKRPNSKGKNTTIKDTLPINQLRLLHYATSNS